MDATVVVPTWQRAPWLERCLRALSRQDRAPDEAIVVGRTEDEAARRVVRATASRTPFPIRWIEVDKPGHVAPVQRGLQAATGEIVTFLDDDAEPEPGWLKALLEPFTHPRVACVGGRVITPGFRGKVKQDAGRVRWYGEHVGNIGALECQKPVGVDSVMEGNWAWRTEVLRRLQFDAVLDYGDAAMYGLDLCLQAKTLGYRVVYHPWARIVHHVAPRDHSLERSDHARRGFGYSQNYTYIGLKHFSGFQRIVFLAWWWLVGDSGSRGLFRTLLNVGWPDRLALPDIPAELAGKLEGMRLWWTARA